LAQGTLGYDTDNNDRNDVMSKGKLLVEILKLDIQNAFRRDAGIL